MVVLINNMLFMRTATVHKSDTDFILSDRSILPVQSPSPEE